MMFFPIIVTIILQYIIVIADVIILVINNAMSPSKSNSDNTVGMIMTKSYQQPMNMAYMTLAQSIIYVIVFGIWFYKVFCDGKIDTDNIKKSLKLKYWLCFIPAGYAAQLMVDGVLTLVRPLFPDAFSHYDKMVSNITGVSSSFVMLLAVILVAPIAEEIIFRGLVLGYGQKIFSPIISILLQGLLFGLYHGNVIQGVYAFFMGVVLGVTAYKLGSVIPTIILHISINASLLFVPKVLFATQTKTIVTTLVAGIVFALLIWMAIREKKD